MIVRLLRWLFTRRPTAKRTPEELEQDHAAALAVRARVRALSDELRVIRGGRE